MLGKLMKYEIKAFGRIMLPLYGLMVVVSVLFAVIMRLSMNGFAKFLLDKFAVISGFLFVAAVLAVMVVMMIMVIQRFYRNLLGTEGYLMFTLPATTLENILSKGITAVLWILIGGVAGVIAGFSMVAIVSDMDEFIRQINEIITYLHGDEELVRNVLLMILMIVFGLIASISKIYAAIAIGHQLPTHKLFGAVIAFIGIGIFEIIITSIPGVRSLLGTQMFEISKVRMTITTVIVSLLQTVLYGAITWWLLDNKLNLE